jgi:signal transduction histidine kinase
MKDRFFSIIAHDLRNPVGSMKTLLDLMLDEYKNMNDEERIQMLESIRLSSTNLYFLLEDLLNWSRSQSGQIIAKKKLIDLHSFCEEQMKMLHPEAGLKNICLKNEVKPELYVFADPDFSSTILRNLISNAVKFTGKGGEVRIDAEEITRETERYFKINVIDTGIGMKAEQLKTIFRIDKAVSKPGTENEKGTGLGLLFCKELAEKQDGELSVTSEPGKGSVFSFTVQAGNIPSNYQLNTC